MEDVSSDEQPVSAQISDDTSSSAVELDPLGTDGSADGGLDDGLDESSRRRKKRPAQDSAVDRPFKRQMGCFNATYLELLNQDIDDAAHAVCLDDDADLPHSQLGLTIWSPAEKRLFFEALARLGRHDLAGIASRVESKSLVEIKHYIHYLDEAQSLRRQREPRSILEIAEYPMAVELSQACCHAQDQAAGAIALRQEHQEMQREEKKWGFYWNITPEVAQGLDQGNDIQDNPALAFARLFRLGNWLTLSRRLFMNSSIPAGNWTFVDHVPPSVWATAFEDLYSLAVSLTRRLVQTTLFFSMSRIRAKKKVTCKTMGFVRLKDAMAAIHSLGMAPEARKFWANSARRLRLNVSQDLADEEEDGGEEPMTYDQVEASLQEDLGDGKYLQSEQGLDDDTASGRSQKSDSSTDSEESNVSLEGEYYTITCEANEVLWHAATHVRDNVSTRRALERAIAIERRQEEQAQRHDEHASYLAEAEMWDILQTRPPMEMPKMPEPGPLERTNVDVGRVCPVSRDWSSLLKYRSEWEPQDRGR